MCVCGATSILADDLLPNKTLRETISRILEAPPTSSTENVGSIVQVQGMFILSCQIIYLDHSWGLIVSVFPDMESALPVQPKIRSPAVSAVSKEEPKETTPVDESPDADSRSGVKATNVDVSSSDKNAITIPDVAEGTMQSKNMKEDKPMEVTLVAKESQEKPTGGEQGEKPLKFSCFEQALARVSA